MFGVYLHIPFCSSKCDYCAFATWTDRHHLTTSYLDALGTEIDRAIGAGMPIADTIFVGGGTPTLVPSELLAEAIASIPRTVDAEVTVECNPDDVTADMLRNFVDGGVNRVSIGVQSMSAHVLESLGRSHDRDNVERAVEAVRAVGLASFNLDIIYGAAGESIGDWESTVDGALALDPPHVSAYGLTVEAGTQLATEPARYPDDDDQADKYDIVESRLTAAGLANYEVSNWARPGHESRHNFIYWRQQNYRGFGCAAHSHSDGRRWWNVRTPDRYIDLVAAGASVEASFELLDADQRRSEGQQLTLRTRDGVERSAFDEATLDLVGEMVVEHPNDPDRVVLTQAGRLMANELSVRMRD